MKPTRTFFFGSVMRATTSSHAASRDDRDQMLTRTYLTSETGKVYTMLAHAAGRFD